ncbi:autotransporter domain-containing protein [Cetobacterium somerae]|uniref:autotransporter family protein n=1 Tax=Cetobacterium sp. NK01 TaxID=2993530 RepID=UPI0021170DAE|nr:autotransporter domain-containing protein [Cetobacterium sp. NK01]MCQ8212090.1 autotransporter domain-containing protein [Cetobacterium sp. NK01]
MKIYNKKYLFLGILASLVTACGSGGGGGGSSYSPTATPSKPTINVSKPTTDIAAPILPIIVPTSKENVEHVDSSEQDNILESEDNSQIEDFPPMPEPPTKNDKNISLDSEGEVGVVALDGKIATNELNGVININAKYATGVLSVGKNSLGVNHGTINGTQIDPNTDMSLMKGIYGGKIHNIGSLNGTGSAISAMSNRSYHGEEINAINTGEIVLNGIENKEGLYFASLIGMEAIKYMEKDDVEEKATLVNDGYIDIHYNDFHRLNPTAVSSMYIQGMSITTPKDSTVTDELLNNKNINVSGRHSAGMVANGKNITLTNKGTIKTEGEDSNGMRGDGENIKVINEGTIDVTGPYSHGISVTEGAVGINETTGTIKINGQNAFAMSATNGSKVINKGKIILNGESIGMYAGNVGANSDKYEISTIVNEGEIIFGDSNPHKIAIWASNNGTYVNKGKILGEDKIEIKTEDKGKFVVGKEASGDISRVRAKRSLRIDGDVVASKDLIDSTKKEITYKDVFSAPKIEVTKAENSKPVSLFYNSNLRFNRSGNVDMIVSRNETTIKEIYEVKEFESLNESFDEYLDEDDKILSNDEKLVVDKISKSNDVNEVKKVVKDLSGDLYANLPRQIFDIQDRFIKEDGKLIENLNDFSYNFNFFGDKSSVKDKGEISGYKATSEGFVGTKKFENDIYATIGYENSNLKYNEGSKGSIQSIHTGVYKKLTTDSFDIKLGLNGEYNFHETNREIDNFDKKAKAKYNSYTLGANGEISKVYGESLYIKPTLGLNLGYGKYEKFSEKNAGELGVTVQDESYFSILPSVGFKVGKNFEFVNLYSNVIYSYELGDLNKKQNMSLLRDKVKYSLDSDNLENESLVINTGISTEIKDFKVTFEIGKEFGKRDNNYLALGVGYKF